MNSTECANRYLWERAQYAAERTLLDVAIGLDGIGLLNPEGDAALQQEEQALEREAEDEQMPQEALTCSFAPQTHVTTTYGKQAISTLHPGEKVWSYNSQTRQMEWKPIVHVWVTHDNDLVDLTITPAKSTQNGKGKKQSWEVIHTNQKHRFLTVEHGFLQVRAIVVGMHIEQADGSVGLVTNRVAIPGSQTMYNLEIAQDHTYVVGDNQWVVHNDCWNLPDHVDTQHVSITTNDLVLSAQGTKSGMAGAFFSTQGAKDAILEAMRDGTGYYQVNKYTGRQDAVFDMTFNRNIGFFVFGGGVQETNQLRVILTQDTSGVWSLKTVNFLIGS